MVVGVKQTLRMIEQGNVIEVFVAEDADQYVTRNIVSSAGIRGIPITKIESMKKLGHMCGIEVGAAVAGMLVKSQHS